MGLLLHFTCDDLKELLKIDKNEHNIINNYYI